MARNSKNSSLNFATQENLASSRPLQKESFIKECVKVTASFELIDSAFSFKRCAINCVWKCCTIT